MRNFKRDHLKNILVLDIETVSAYPKYKDMPETWQKMWNKKAAFLAKDDQTAEDVYERAGIYSEFGKIICIVVGIFTEKGGEIGLRLKSFYGDDEKELLQNFTDLLDSRFDSDQFALCGHNGKEFDFPYLARRILVNGIRIPRLLDLHGKKPWEVNHLDTMELWKFGDYKKYTSLEVLATLFGIPTPKDDIDGSMVGPVYWEENDLDRIVHYCNKDVITTARLLLKMVGVGEIDDENVDVAT